MKIALVGNQNSGKTTLFNLLTGMNAKIGNWPGVTIEKKSGIIKNTNYEIVDLPGIYSLSPYSIEEEISRKFIFDEKPDIIINIIDTNVLERSLYLTTQLLELDCKVIIALNMVDVLEKKGLRIEEKKLEMLLGISAVKISALNGDGVENLITKINDYNNVNKSNNNLYIYDAKLERAISKIKNELEFDTNHKRFISIKLLEKDERFENIDFVGCNFNKVESLIEETSKFYDMDLEEVIATERYAFIEEVKKQVISVFKKYDLEDKHF